MDRAKLFAAVRSTVFSGHLSEAQVNGIEAILDGCEGGGVTDLRQIAYILATPMIETGGSFVPVSENLNYSAAGLRETFPKYFTPAQAQSYARQPQRIANRAYANRMGNGPETSGDGWKYRGRGFSQCTGHDNYGKFSKLLGVDLVSNPDLAMSDDIAAKIIVIGMRDGIFTGHKLSNYFEPDSADWIGARRIINGQDKAQQIASYAKQFYAALKAA
ncbi:glycoside hydrolase family 19 protein [Rhizobium sp. NXC24]|uniref:glycoside hydrolase family 19 protein n=1 Tax=Rhizobium sp. NXC24 TaxID=2048897 RepID=UPI000CDF4112|nr:glycoside hydrolase family 19 protein [Rhizobium sp. NXC24]AVA22459.1 phage-related lysozyme-like domain-containing protein [Rhizobium sp. NXC24]